jgi:hypothetical protein
MGSRWRPEAATNELPAKRNGGMRRLYRTFKPVVLLLCTLPLLQVSACGPNALTNAVSNELIRSASEFVFINGQTVFQNLLGV